MFVVEYYAPFAQEWRDYVAATHNAKVVKHETRNSAEKAMAYLQSVHPRDTLRVVEKGA